MIVSSSQRESGSLKQLMVYVGMAWTITLKFPPNFLLYVIEAHFFPTPYQRRQTQILFILLDL